MGDLGNPPLSMNQRSRRPAPISGLFQHSIRSAWLSTLGVVTAIAVAQWADVLLPIPFLLLLTTVVASGAIGGVVSGSISGLLMAMTIFYFWSQGMGPEALTGTLFRAILGSVVAVTVGYCVGRMREYYSARVSELEQRELDFARQNRELSDRVDEQSVDLQLASDRLRDSRARLRRAARRWIRAEETERRALARELHNDIGQGLTALHLNLEIGKKSFEHDPQLQRMITTSKQLIGEIAHSVRQLSLILRPSVLDDLGFVAAVREHVSIQFNEANIDFEFNHEGDDALIAPDTRIVAYRLMQEAVRNVIQHSDASHARVDIRVGEDCVVFHIKDNGKGFDSNELSDESEHPGLTSMRERASLMSGSCEIRSKPHEGTDVAIMLPLIIEEIAA